ncbi:hypothetical protein J6590_017766 [Homalodisca vitripennis]|nr:hypothetical protein J6590_017766 [Homalodisca vitripennis]
MKFPSLPSDLAPLYGTQSRWERDVGLAIMVEQIAMGRPPRPPLATNPLDHPGYIHVLAAAKLRPMVRTGHDWLRGK